MWLGRGGRRPEEAREFTRYRDDGYVMRLSAGAHVHVNVVQAMLGTVGDRQDMLGLTVLTALERRADPRLASGVPC